MPDPTNARLRDFDIPVIMPRFAFLTLPPPPDDDTPHTPVTTATCGSTAVAGPATVVTQVVASKGVPAPVVLIGLPAKNRRRTSTFLQSGLPFSVSSDKAISDVEVRLIQLLPKGRKRPLGVELVLAPGKRSLTAVVLALPFAKSKLSQQHGGAAVRAVAVVTAYDGSVGQVHADFTLT